MSYRSSRPKRNRSRPLSESNGPRILKVLSSQPVFIVCILLTIIVIAVSTGIAYYRVNSCIVFSNTSITMNGSTAIAPLLKDVANEYQTKCLNTKITVNASKFPQGSLNGLKQVEQKDVDIGTSDVFANIIQNPDLEDHQVVVAVFALVVNSSVNITNLTTDQIRRIYSGDVTNWNELGSNKNLDIVRVSRPPTSGTRATFEKYVLDGIETVSGPQSLLTDTSDTVAQSVKMQEGAIGYVSLYYARKFGLTILSINGSNPTNLALVRSGTYKFWNIEHLYTKGPANGLAKSFIEHMFSGAAKQIANNDSYLSTTEFAPSVLRSHVAQI